MTCPAVAARNPPAMVRGTLVMAMCCPAAGCCCAAAETGHPSIAGRAGELN